MFSEIISNSNELAKKHKDRLQPHTNVEAIQLLEDRTVRRLKRLKPFELV
jgi:hypothetical protein